MTVIGRSLDGRKKGPDGRPEAVWRMAKREAIARKKPNTNKKNVAPTASPFASMGQRGRLAEATYRKKPREERATALGQKQTFCRVARLGPAKCQKLKVRSRHRNRQCRSTR